MEKIVGQVTKPPKARRDDDITDRLSSRYTVMMLVIFAIVISISQWVGKPMYCWVPKHFTDSWTKYANSFCWVNNTYYLPFHEYIPREGDHRHHITYYQWIPWILLSQAFFFYVPSVLWHGFNSKAGIDSDDILQSACQLQTYKMAERREAKIDLMCVSIDRFLRNRKDGKGTDQKVNCCKKSCDCNCGGRRWSAYLVVLYLISKVAYLVNIICQMFVLGSILNTDYEQFGPEYFNTYNPNGTYSGEFINSIVFPRVTMCDFNIRLVGNVQRYTVQCALPLNLYLEKMYLFFWFWLLFLITATGIDLIIWFIRAVIPADRRNFVKNHLLAGNFITTEKDNYMAYEFVDDYLKQDGAFLLRMIAHNTSTITTADVTGNLFKQWREQELSDIRVVDGGTEEEEIIGQDNDIDDEEDVLVKPEKTQPDPDMEITPPGMDVNPSELEAVKPVPV